VLGVEKKEKEKKKKKKKKKKKPRCRRRFFMKTKNLKKTNKLHKP
jgi:hypothetical protein